MLPILPATEMELRKVFLAVSPQWRDNLRVSAPSIYLD